MTKKIRNFWLEANWRAPKHIKAGTSLRTNGCSKSPFNKSNLSFNVGDNPENVEKNRSCLLNHLKIDESPVWLEQIHSEKIICTDKIPENLKADGSYTTKQNRVCVVTTADCVPLLFCNNEGTKVAAIHAGWKGICRGIIKNATKIFSQPESVMVWIGPCISSKYYEVGADVYSSCVNYSALLETAFKKKNDKKWYCSLRKITKILLKNYGISEIYDSHECTYQNKLFFSYRRDGNTGRTASMIWIA